MKQWIIGKREVITILFLLLVIGILFGYVAGSKDVNASVGYKDIILKVGDRDDDRDENGVPFEEAIAAIYNRTADMEKSVSFLLDYTHKEMIRNIENQYSIIRAVPDDAKKSDIIKALDDWDNIPEMMKGIDLDMKYQFILRWHELSINNNAYIAYLHESII